MRKDVKTGMLAGTILCLIAIVWFCAKQQIISQPLMKFESPNLVESENNEIVETVLGTPPQGVPYGTYGENDEPVQQQSQKNKKPDITETFVIHIVTGGQTLSDISKIYYDSPHRWKKIYEANKEQFPKGPDAIMPGMKLTIPQ